MKKVYLTIATISSLLALNFESIAQSTAATNTLTGTAPAPTQYIGSANAYDLVFKTNAVERMRILGGTTNTGFMGIGITSPLYKLHVGGNTLFSTSTSAPVSAALINANTTWSLATTPDYTWAGNTNTGIFHPALNTIGFSNNGVETMRIMPDGSVGIGTTTPGTTLDITAPTPIIRLGTTVNSGLARLTLAVVPTAGVLSYVAKAGDIVYGANCGTTGSLIFTLANTNNGAIRFTTNNNQSCGSNGPDTEKMTILNNGQVLISDVNGGTSSMQTKLTTATNVRLGVNGNIYAKGIKIWDVTNWADFVFSPTYKLRSLDEVKDYIAVNKHLPEIPSEKEIIENGIDTSEMLKLQMQKIEELTLYLIELKKENENIKNRLNGLELNK